MHPEYIHMGRLGRPHGIAGEIVLEWFAVSPFSCSKPYFLREKNLPPSPVTILAAREHRGRLLVRIDGITDRTGAERLRGRDLLLCRSELPELPDGEAYICDLMGSDVFLTDGSRVGTFSHVLQGAKPLWVIVQEGTEILFPAEESFIVSLDPKAMRIVIAPPPGLLELYLGREEA